MHRFGKSLLMLACGLFLTTGSLVADPHVFHILSDKTSAGLHSSCGRTILRVDAPAEGSYDSYRWEMSTDGIHWTEVEDGNINLLIVSPVSQNTYYRVEVEYNGNSYYSAENFLMHPTPTTPYISNAAELIAALQSSTGYYELTADIDLSGIDWYPVTFGGVLDGKGHTISNMTFSINKDFGGLVAYLEECGVIQNLTLTNVACEGWDLMGAVAGKSAGTIRNVTVEGGFIHAYNTIPAALIKTRGMESLKQGTQLSRNNLDYSRLYEKQNILAAAAQEMLAHANQNNQGLLNFLGSVKVPLSTEDKVTTQKVHGGDVVPMKIVTVPSNPNGLTGSISFRRPSTQNPDTAVFIGGICGVAVEGSSIEYCTVKDLYIDAFQNGEYIGGIAGYTVGDILNSTVINTSLNYLFGLAVTTYPDDYEIDYSLRNVGGIAGCQGGGMIANNAVFHPTTATFVAHHNVGGLVGQQLCDTLRNNMFAGTNKNGTLGNMLAIVPSTIDSICPDYRGYISNCYYEANADITPKRTPATLTSGNLMDGWSATDWIVTVSEYPKPASIASAVAPEYTFTTINNSGEPTDTVCGPSDYHIISLDMEGGISISSNFCHYIQWQSSPDRGLTWYNIPNATTWMYRLPAVTDTTLYRPTVLHNGWQYFGDTIMEVPAPWIDIVSPDTVCNGTSIAFSISNEPEGVTWEYKWETWGGDLEEEVWVDASTLASQIFTADNSQTMQYEIAVRDKYNPNACKTSERKYIAVVSPPGHLADVNKAVCTGDRLNRLSDYVILPEGYRVPTLIEIETPLLSVLYDAESVAGTLYWSTTRNGVYSSTLPTPTTEAANMYTYYMYFQVGDGCPTDTAVFTLTVNETPQVPTISNYSIGYCQYAEAHAEDLAALVSPDNASFTIEWATSQMVNHELAFSTTVPTPTTDKSGLQRYYVRQSKDGCAGLHDDILVNITRNNAPIFKDTILNYCKGESLPYEYLSEYMSESDYTAYPHSTWTYYYKVNDGAWTQFRPDNTEAEDIINTATAGTTTYSFYRIGNSGCTSPVSTVTVHIGEVPKPATLLTEDVTYCSGATATSLSEQVSAPTAGHTIYWKAGDGAFSPNPLPTPSTERPEPKKASPDRDTTVYTVYQTLNGCRSDESTLKVIVKYTPKLPNINSTGMSLHHSEETYYVCQGEMESVILTQPTNSDVKWKIAGSGLWQTSNTITFDTETPNTTTYEYKSVSRSNDCENASTFNVTVRSIPVVTVSGDDNGTICKGANLTANVTLNGEPIDNESEEDSWWINWWVNDLGHLGTSDCTYQITGETGTYMAEVQVKYPLSPTSSGRDLVCYGYSDELEITTINNGAILYFRGYNSVYNTDKIVFGSTNSNHEVEQVSGLIRTDIEMCYGEKLTVGTSDRSLLSSQGKNNNSGKLTVGIGESVALSSLTWYKDGEEFAPNGIWATLGLGSAAQRDITEPGWYSVRATATNGCVTMDSIHVTAVRKGPDVEVLTSAPLAKDAISMLYEGEDGCSDAGYLCWGDFLIANPTNGEASFYQWSDGMPLMANKNKTLDVSRIVPRYAEDIHGFYSVTAYSPEGCPGDMSDFVAIIDINAKSEIRITGESENEICYGEDLTVEITTGENASSIAWTHIDDMDIATAGSTTNTQTVTENGKYIVNLTNQYNCSTTDSVEVAVNPKAVVSITGDDEGSICKGANLIANVSGVTENLTYQWKQNDIALPETNQNTHSITEEDSYQVEVTTDKNCVSGAETIITFAKDTPVVALTEDIINVGLDIPKVVHLEEGTSTEGVWTSANSDWLSVSKNDDGSGILNGNEEGEAKTLQVTYTVTGDNGCQGKAMITANISSLFPIELMYFKARCTSNNHLIEWQTASELNSDYFSLERSFDFDTWEEVKKIPAAINSNSFIDYSTTLPASPFQTYYRLRLYNNDGSVETYSPTTVFCQNDEDNKPQLFYAIDTDNLHIDNLYEASDLTINDITGRTLYKTHLAQYTTLNLSWLAQGSYTAILYSPTQKIVCKFVKARNVR